MNGSIGGLSLSGGFRETFDVMKREMDGVLGGWNLELIDGL